MGELMGKFHHDLPIMGEFLAFLILRNTLI